MLLSMVGCCVVCRALPAASSIVQICQPSPSCGALLLLFLLGCRPLLLTIASRCLLLFYQASITFAAPVEGWLLRSLPAQQHTNYITRLKMFPVSTSWTYCGLLRVSTCKRMKNLKGCQFFLSTYFVTTLSELIPTYMEECVSATGLTDTSQKIGRHNRMLPTCRDDIRDMLATDRNVCRLRGVANRHKSRDIVSQVQVDPRCCTDTGAVPTMFRIFEDTQ